jgi:hypothetical protein
MKEASSIVRVATEKDESRIFEILCLAEKENAMFPMDEDKVIAFIRRATLKDGGIIGIVGEGQAEATVGLIIEQAWYTTSWSLGERWNFVHPDFRKTDHVSKLIGFSKKCADELGLPLDIGILSNIRTEAKIRLYKRHFKFMGAFFSYNHN